MSKVRVSIDMKHSMLADPTIVVKLDERYVSSGPTSSISWENPDLLSTLKQLFHIKPRETLTGIEVTRHGITARITTLEAKT